MAAKLVNEALTSSSDYGYLVPLNCVSVAFYAKTGDIVMQFGSDADTWSGLTTSNKEQFSGDSAKGLRGLVITFNAVSTADLEIRTITFADV